MQSHQHEGSDALASFMAQFGTKKEIAKTTGETTRTVDRNLRGPNGIRKMKVAGKVMIHKGDYADFLQNKITQSNPIRGSR